MGHMAFCTGMDRLLRNPDRWLGGASRVALLSHQAAVVRSGFSAAQALREVLGRRLVALLGPEHGFDGVAGAGVATRSRRHAAWGIPVYSLYGAQRKPTPRMLAGVDLLLVDFQDLGARCYTYLATVKLALEAAAEHGVRVVVTDRPIPLPAAVDGPVTEPEWVSFVAPAALPMSTAMTPGEAARWLVDTGPGGPDLTVVPYRGAPPDGALAGDGPEWIPPSPGIRTWESATTYLATVFTEALPNIDCGRGTGLAFRLLGAPWMRSAAVCDALNAEPLPGVRFVPYRYAPGGGPHAGRVLDGIRLAVTSRHRFRPVTTGAAVLTVLTRLYGVRRVWHHKGARPEWFDKLYGTTRCREHLSAGGDWQELSSAWRREHRRLAAARKKALLYSRAGRGA